MPSVNLDISKQNFVFKSTQIWNKLTKILFINCLPHTSGIVIPGSTKYSDMTTPICVFKNKIKNHILYTQKLGYAEIWAMENVLHCNQNAKFDDIPTTLQHDKFNSSTYKLNDMAAY